MGTVATHLPAYLEAEVFAAAKRDRLTLSMWLRRLIERELAMPRRGVADNPVVHNRKPKIAFP